MRKILGVVEYDGTAYKGWQKQPGGQTIQDELEAVLSRIFNEPITIYGSGRTDAGVHALNQTFHFTPNKKVADLKTLAHSINCLLNKDIKVKSLKYVNKDFHARLSAVGKQYLYRFAINETSVFNYPYLSLVYQPFDLEKLKESLQLFVGKHCFKNFTSKEEDQWEFIRTIQEITLKKKTNGLYEISFIGDGFMRYEIRYIVGTCFAYANGKITLDKIKHQLDGKTIDPVSYKAEGKGLYLAKVLY